MLFSLYDIIYAAPPSIVLSLKQSPRPVCTSSHRQLHRTLTRFVRLRRHEQMSLHQAVQGLKTSEMKWLCRVQGDVAIDAIIL